MEADSEGFWHRRWLALGPLAVGLAGPLTSPIALAENAGQITPDSLTRRIRFSYLFSNPHDRLLKDQTYWGYLPMMSSQVQSHIGTRVSVAHSVETDDLQHQVLKVHFAEVSPFAKRTVAVTTELKMANAPAPTPTGLQDPRQWLSSDRFVNLDDPAIRALALQLRTPDAGQTAFAIYQWVSKNILYAGYLADDLGASEALRLLRGDCTEFASLAVALARCCGIPARMVGGYVLDRDANPRPADYHDWAELHFAGSWQLVDCQKQRWLGPVREYVAFRIHQDVAANAIGSAHRYRIAGDMTVTW